MTLPRSGDPDWLLIHPDQWERIATVVRGALAEFGQGKGCPGDPFDDALDALTPDDIEAVKP